MDTILIENLIKVGMAVVVGGLIGAEREYQDKAAGFRTIILITVGSTLFTIFSVSMDPGFTRTRVAANIVTGIGFLGAGAIVREHGKIGGLTTAATIWLAAALGMGIGAGELMFVSLSTVIVVIILLVFPRIESRIDRIRESRTYKIVVTSQNLEMTENIYDSIRDCSLQVLEHHQSKTGETIIGTWRAIGSPENHEKFVGKMMRDKGVKELVY
ncbi:MAG TPA: MgtC/SapB family protein [Anaerolineales bacterium]|nr:MgtC/SapB family protein [Anaerolineales bacterium]